MGSSLSQYSFSDSSMDNYKVYVVDTVDQASEAAGYLRKYSILYVDCEGHYFGNTNGQIELVQISNNKGECYLFDVITVPNCIRHLKGIFTDSSICKVFHDCSGDVAELQKLLKICIKGKIHDIQILQKFLEIKKRGFCETGDRNLEVIFEAVTGRSYPRVNTPHYGQNKWIDRRPLTEAMVKYAAQHVLLMKPIFDKQSANVDANAPNYRDEVTKRMNSKITESLRK